MDEDAAHPDFTGLWERQDELRSKLLQWVRSYDVVLCPAAGKPAQPIQSDTYSRRARVGGKGRRCKAGSR